MRERDYKKRIAARDRIDSIEVRTKKEKRGRLGFLGVLSIVLAVMIGIMSIYLLFHVQKFEVRGNEYSASTETVNWIKEDEWATNSIYLCLKFLFVEQELPPYATDIEVSMRAPWTVRVDVKERQPIAGVELPDKYVYFDAEGIVMSNVAIEYEGIPMVQGMEVTESVLYEPLPVEDEDIFQNILEVTKFLQLNELEPESIINSSSDDIELVFGTITVQVGDGNYEEKMLQIKPMLEKLEGQEGTLDLRSYSSTDTVTNFKKKTTENQ